ncbi:MAG: outer membrane homotrimeric porin [Desulfovibrionaceae bacterium]|nr:outer membrane homotrimeric porin [Desulfovibrionaceae bacterium]
MKKLVIALLTAGLALGAAAPSHAIDFKAHGQWLFSINYGQHGTFSDSGKTGYDGSEDEFEPRSRVRVWLDAIASESLSGQVYFEIGKSIWGRSSASGSQGGAALGADDTIVKVRRAFIDWMVPETDLKVRMGIQVVGTPYAALDGASVLQADVAGVMLSYRFNDMVALTGGWIRPYNDNYSTTVNNTSNYMDNLDMGLIALPIRGDSFKLTPWGMYGAIGPNTFRTKTTSADSTFGKRINGVDGNYFYQGMFPLWANVSGVTKSNKITSYGNAWWGGLAGEFTGCSPLRVAAEFMYGSVDWPDDESMRRQGWLAAAVVEYKLDWVTPGLFGWYASGDDDDISNGSERMPYVAIDHGMPHFGSTFAGSDQNGLERDRVIANQLSGTWGVGFRLKNMSFLDNLKHTFLVALWGGTNQPGIVEELHKKTGGDYMTPNKTYTTTSAYMTGRENLYMTTQDNALEFTLRNSWKACENLTLNLDASYIKLFIDTDDTWKHSHTGGLQDAWNVSFLMNYSF